MSFSGNSSNSKSQSTSQTHLDPTETGLVNQNAVGLSQAIQNPNSDISYKPYTGPGLNFGDPATLQGLTTYQAPTATGTGYTAAQIAPGAVPGVTAGQIASTDLSPYLNPYTGDVINTTTAQLARQNQIDNTNAAGQATAAGAFGGSRAAVLQNLNTDSYQRNLDQTLAGLNASNFSQAQNAAGQDIASKLAAEQGNQQAGLSVAQANQGAQNQGLQFGAAAQNTASLANQQANLAAAQTKLQALGINEQQAEAMFGSNWAQYLNSQQDPQALQALVNQAFSILPTSPLASSQSTGSGSSAGFSFAAPK